MLVVIKWKFPIDSQRDVIREGLIAQGKTSIHVIAAAVQKSFIFCPRVSLPPPDLGWPPERLPLARCGGVRHLVISLSQSVLFCDIFYDSSLYSTTAFYWRQCIVKQKQVEQNRSLLSYLCRESFLLHARCTALNRFRQCHFLPY